MVDEQHSHGTGPCAGFNAVEIICAKRDGHRLSDQQIAWIVDRYVAGEIADEQMAALLMAVCLRGMDERELAALTGAYVASGDVLDWSDLPGPTVDKHSTGGVGDKTTLILTPLVAACGALVPQLSGRGLGHTGGTLDKLEAVPGWRSTLTGEEMRSALRSAGGFIAAASDRISPADRLLYRLRDVTGTVESIPLIAASIMSKKIAAGPKALVLDVKIGSGAFMKTAAQGVELAEAMLAIGARAGITCRAVLSRMDHPLGRSAGNALEVREALDVLAGGGPADTRNLVLVLAQEMLDAAGLDPAHAEAALDSGRAMDRFRRIVHAHGGDPDAPLPRARHVETIRAARSGTVTSIDALAVGMSAWHLGAGRARKEDGVDPTAGVRWLAGIGESVCEGDVLFELHTGNPDRITRAAAALDGAFTIGGAELDPRPQVLGIIR